MVKMRMTAPEIMEIEKSDGCVSYAKHREDFAKEFCEISEWKKKTAKH